MLPASMYPRWTCRKSSATPPRLTTDDSRVRSKLEEINAYAPNKGAPDDRLVLMAKFGIVLNDWMDAN